MPFCLFVTPGVARGQQTGAVGPDQLTVKPTNLSPSPFTANISRILRYNITPPGAHGAALGSRLSSLTTCGQDGRPKGWETGPGLPECEGVTS